MDILKIHEYQKYAKMGYLTPISCKQHPWSPILISADFDGIYWNCGFCFNKYYISYGEYRDIEQKLVTAQHLFLNSVNFLNNTDRT